MGEDASLDRFATASATDVSEDDEDEGSDENDENHQRREEPGDREDPRDQRDAVRTADAETAGAAEPTTPGGSGMVSPTVTTYEWTSAGATCGTCGESTERRWRDGGTMVCPDCKEW